MWATHYTAAAAAAAARVVPQYLPLGDGPDGTARCSPRDL